MADILNLNLYRKRRELAAAKQRHDNYFSGYRRIINDNDPLRAFFMGEKSYGGENGVHELAGCVSDYDGSLDSRTNWFARHLETVTSDGDATDSEG